jgi:uncharacterized RDD family membrane protein YckC
MAPGSLSPTLRAPALGRRLACLVYEGVLLFGVVIIAGLLYGMLTQQRHALVGMHGLQLFVFVVLGLYFGWFWTHGGQTVAMKTWRIRLLDRHGQPVTAQRALLRFLLSWLWFLPALGYAHLARLDSGASIATALIAGMLLYAALVVLDRERQFLHDRLSGTRLVVWSTQRCWRAAVAIMRPRPRVRSACIAAREPAAILRSKPQPATPARGSAGWAGNWCTAAVAPD